MNAMTQTEIDTQIAEPIAELDERALVLSTGSNIDRRLALREVIRQVEQGITAIPDHFCEDPFPLKHEFTEGAYARSIFLPKGTLVVGKIHRHAHFNFVQFGDVSVLTEDGPRRFQGPLFMTSSAGTKRVVYAHEDTVWTTIHATQETDLEKVEQFVIAPNYEALLEVSK